MTFHFILDDGILMREPDNISGAEYLTTATKSPYKTISINITQIASNM